MAIQRLQGDEDIRYFDRLFIRSTHCPVFGEQSPHHLNFFPAQAIGGVPVLKAIDGSFHRVTFCPTGGITPENYLDSLALDNVVCVGGSWLVPADAAEKGDWEQITRLAQHAIAQAGACN